MSTTLLNEALNIIPADWKGEAQVYGAATIVEDDGDTFTFAVHELRGKPAPEFWTVAVRICGNAPTLAVADLPSKAEASAFLLSLHHARGLHGEVFAVSNPADTLTLYSLPEQN